MIISHDSQWDEITEVIIIGYGMAGAVSAITASDFGAQVLVLDKQPEENFCTTSHLSGGSILVADDVKSTVRYMQSLNKIGTEIPWTEPDIVQVWAEYVTDNKKWIEKMGGHVSLSILHGEYEEVPGYEGIKSWRYNGMGFAMMKNLNEQVKKRKIEVKYGTAANKILTNLNNEVIGVQSKSKDGKILNIAARRAVILSSGGFEFNEWMKLNYLKAYPAYFTGSTANTGDGIKMAMSVGADLWHMNCCSARWVAKFPELKLAINLDLGGKGWMHHITKKTDVPPVAGYVVVDQNGKRFTDENHKPHGVYYELALFDSNKLKFPRIPSFWIFDQKRFEAGPLPSMRAESKDYKQEYTWSKDNSEELEKGWIVSGRTLRELAGKLDLPADALEKSVSGYNESCQKGKDEQFNRRPIDLISLESPPYYGVKLWPGGPNTQGGPRRNFRGQILNTDGLPIKGLYGAGELGSVYAMMYPLAGGNLAECIAFGRISGENAAREEPLLTNQIA
jgi:succinate dehydrogenase/fumarate reductase flavoprotein subunit